MTPATPARFSIAFLLDMQRRAGNRAVMRLIDPGRAARGGALVPVQQSIEVVVASPTIDLAPVIVAESPGVFARTWRWLIPGSRGHSS